MQFLGFYFQFITVCFPGSPGICFSQITHILLFSALTEICKWCPGHKSFTVIGICLAVASANRVEDERAGNGTRFTDSRSAAAALKEAVVGGSGDADDPDGEDEPRRP